MWTVKEEEGVIVTWVVTNKVYAVHVHISRRRGN